MLKFQYLIAESIGGIITPKLADDYGQAVVELNITALAVLSGYHIGQANGKGRLLAMLARV
jgi:hypothetical protein